MGHRLGDLEALDRLIGRIGTLLSTGVLATTGILLEDRPEFSIRATSFAMAGRLQADRWLDPESVGEPLRERTMLRLFFRKEPKDDPWFLDIRVDWEDRTDQLPDEGRLSIKVFRRVLTPRRRVAETRERLSDWSREEDLWVPSSQHQTPSADLLADIKAQVGLFLLQVELLEEPGKSAIAAEVLGYLRGILPEDDAAASHAYDKLIKNHWWPTGARSFRAYVTTTAWYNPERPRSPVRLPATDGPFLTIAAAAHLTEISRSALYWRIRQGKIRTRREGRGPMLIAREDVLQLHRRLKPGPFIKELMKAEPGLSKAAARKRIQRHKGDLKKLFGVAPSRPDGTAAAASVNRKTAVGRRPALKQ